MTSGDGASRKTQPDRPLGNPARDAIAARRGYLYQDYQAALAWFDLPPGETLYLEVAEDYVTSHSKGMTAVQVKHISRKLTLNDKDVRDALANFVELTEKNVGRPIRYVFLSTAHPALERKKDHRPAGEAGLSYWRKVQDGGDIAPLRKALLRMSLAPQLKSFIEQRSDSELREDLVARITWVLGQDSVDAVRGNLQERIAAELLTRGIEKPEGRKQEGNVLLKVVTTAQLPNPADRKLDKDALKDLLDELAHTWVPRTVLEALSRKAEIADNLPTELLDERVEYGTRELKYCRHFVGYDNHKAAVQLADSVRLGGRYAGATPSIRATALAWGARVLVDADPDRAALMIEQARALMPDCAALRLVEAIQLAPQDVFAAMGRLASLDTPEAMSARYLVQRRSVSGEAGLERALSWFEGAGVTITDFDEDGQARVLDDLLRSGRWEVASSQVSLIETQRVQHPQLLLVCALQALCEAVTEERRAEVLDMPPVWNLLEFPLSATDEGLASRERALALFRRVEDAAESLNLDLVQQHAEEFKIWLVLAKVPGDAEAIARIETLLVSSELWKRWVPMALSAKIELDQSAARKQLDQEFIRTGSLDFLGARAYLALLLAPSAATTPQEWAQAREKLVAHFMTDFLIAMEVHAFLRDGRIDDARAAVQNVKDERLSGDITTEIEKQSGQDVLAKYRDDYAMDRSLFHLQRLIQGLGERARWAELAEYVRILFDKTGTVESAEQYIDALRRAEKWSELANFIIAHPGFQMQSSAFAEAALQVALLSANWAGVREVLAAGVVSPAVGAAARFQTAALSLQWQDFSPLIDGALSEDGDHEAASLLQLASIAACIDRSPESRQLALRAAQRAKDNPQVLMQAYMLAVQGMWEHEEQAEGWFANAVALSDSGTGPLQKRSLDEVLELAPKWRKRSESAWSALQSQEIWLGGYAKMVNRPISQLMSGAAITNRDEPNVRARIIVPAFSGARAAPSAITSKELALHATSLLTLANLDLLDELPKAIEKIYVAHDIGIWLIEQLQHATFHQPRNIKEAVKLLNLIAQERVRVMESPRVGDSRLVGQVGEELADLLTYARTETEAENACYVIRTAPVPVVAARLNKNADLEAFAPVLRSLRCLVDSMEGAGHLTPAEASRAKSFFHRVDEGWEGDERIERGSTLLLDELSVHYLQHTALLQKLASAGYRLLVHEHVRAQAREYASLEEPGQKLRALLNRIREFLSSGVRDGRVQVLPMPKESWGRKQAELSDLQILDSEGAYQSVVFDDRYFNRYETINLKGNAQLGIHSTLDVLDLLLRKDAITEARWMAMRTELRRCGYAVVPITKVELAHALENTKARSTPLLEGADLRAIRESVSLLQMRGILRLPVEAPWLEGMMEAVSEFANDTLEGSEDQRKTEIVGWARQVADIRLFGESLQGEMSGSRVRLLSMPFYTRMSTHLMLSIAPPDSMEIATGLLGNLAWRDPPTFSWLAQHIKSVLLSLKEEYVKAAKGPQEASVAQAVVGVYAARLPEVLRREVIRQDAGGALGLAIRQMVLVHVPGDPEFDWAELWQAAASVAATGSSIQVKDVAGRSWNLLAAGVGDVALELPDDQGNRPLALPDVELASPIRERRLKHLAALCNHYGLDEESMRASFDLVEAHALSPSEAELLRLRLEEFPLPFGDRIRRDIATGSAEISSLFPADLGYFRNLLGGRAVVETLQSFAESVESMDGDFTPQRLRAALLISGHSSTIPAGMVSAATAQEVESFVEGLVGGLDVWSITGLIEAVLSRPDALLDLATSVTTLLEAFQQSLQDTRLALAASLFKVTDLRLRALDPECDLPNYWRRLASIAHSALLERVLYEASSDVPAISESLEERASSYYWASLPDMRREPRWSPLAIDVPQLRQELAGRVVGAFGRHLIAHEPIVQAGVREQMESLQEVLRGFKSMMAGPVEGACEVSEIPSSILEDIEDLRDAPANYWRAIVAAGQVWRLPRNTLKAMASALQSQSAEVMSSLEDGPRSDLLIGLANLAAAARDPELGRAVSGVARALSRKGAVTAAICLFVSLTAAAANAEEDLWRESVIDAAYYAAGTSTDRNDASNCLAAIEGLELGDWRLAIPMSRAKAMLQSAVRS